MRRIAVRFDAQGAQRRGRWVQIPRGIERRDLLHLPGIIDAHLAASQWKDMMDGRIAQGELYIRIVIGQVGEFLDQLLEEARLESGSLDPDGEHGERLRLEQVTPLGPGKGHRDGLVFQKTP